MSSYQKSLTGMPRPLCYHRGRFLWAEVDNRYLNEISLVKVIIVSREKIWQR